MAIAELGNIRELRTAAAGLEIDHCPHRSDSCAPGRLCLILNPNP